LSGELVALLSALLWAVSSVLIAVGAKRLHVLPLNLVRCLISTTFFWAMLLFYGGFQALATIPSSAWPWLVVSVLGLLVVGDTFYFRSMELAGVSWAMPVASITPLWAVLLAWFFVEEPLTWSLFVGSLLVVLGIAFISRSTAQKAGGNPVDPKARRTGLLMALGVSVLWAVGQVALKPAAEGTPSVVVNSVRQPMAAMMLLAITLVRGRWRDLQGLDRRSWAVIVAASLLGTGFGTLFFVMAIQMAGAGRTAVLSATAPMMAIPFAMLWLQEQPTRWTLFGTFLTAVGIALVV
jgi:drug/metabolite transporter (DMT)-like permease